MSPRVNLISLGGTISMTGERGERVVPALTTESILASVPQVGDIADIEAVSLRQLPGAHLVEDDVIELAGVIESRVRGGTEAIVVTQGTDTLEESAFVLESILSVNAPVVLTGALRNPGMVGADGPANLMGAVLTAASASARGLGVLVVMNDEIHSARFVRKVHASRPSAFASPLTGPIGWVSEGNVRIVARPARTPSLSIPQGSRARAVALLKAGLGDDGRLVRVARNLGFEGLVMEGFGGGHVPPGMADALEAVALVMPVVLASRTGSGEVLQRTYGFIGSEVDLLSRGLISAGYLDGLKARLLLSLLLRTGATQLDVIQAFRDRSIVSFI